MFFGALHVQHLRIIIALVQNILLLLPEAFEVNWDLSARVPLPVPTPRLKGGLVEFTIKYILCLLWEACVPPVFLFPFVLRLCTYTVCAHAGILSSWCFGLKLKAQRKKTYCSRC